MGFIPYIKSIFLHQANNMETINLNLQVNFEQIVQVVVQLPSKEQLQLFELLKGFVGENGQQNGKQQATIKAPVSNYKWVLANSGIDNEPITDEELQKHALKKEEV